MGDDRFCVSVHFMSVFSRLSRWRRAQNDMFRIQKNQTCTAISQFLFILI